jgi:cytochrome c-type biogenesis protein CcmE
MKARHKRLFLIAASAALLALATYFILAAFQKNLVFFFTPSQINNGEAPQGRSFRLGGMVLPGSLQRASDSTALSFSVTDQQHTVRVHYQGMLPDLFKEGKGVVAQGKFAVDGELIGQFIADEVLAKHDENYMPPQAQYALEQAKAQAKK